MIIMSILRRIDMRNDFPQTHPDDDLRSIMTREEEMTTTPINHPLLLAVAAEDERE